MANNIIDFASRLADSKFSKAAKQSAGRVYRASRDAIETSQAEGRRVFTTARREGMKLQKFAKVPKVKMAKLPRFTVIEDMQQAATDRIDRLEKVFQKRVDGVLKDLGIPTAKEVATLSRRVEELAVKVEARARRARKAPVRARRKTAKVVMPKAEAA